MNFYSFVCVLTLVFSVSLQASGAEGRAAKFGEINFDSLPEKEDAGNKIDGPRSSQSAVTTAPSQASPIHQSKTHYPRYIVGTAPQVSTGETRSQAPAQSEDPSELGGNYSFGLGGGAINYPKASNLPMANGAAGVIVGMRLFSNFWLDGGFIYSFQEAEINRVTGQTVNDIDQFQISAVAKQRLVNWTPASWFVPLMGVATSLTRRQYNVDENSSNAFDAGLVGGFDIAMNRSVTLALEYRYMFNVDYEREKATNPVDVASQRMATGNNVKNLESFDYQMVLLTGKIVF